MNLNFNLSFDLCKAYEKKKGKKKKAKEENVVETRNKKCDGMVCIFCLLVKIEIVTVVKAVTFIVGAAAMIDAAMIDMIPTVEL